MATDRTLALILLAAISPVVALASGDWFEQAPAMLPSYLDRLPAKSLGTLYLETAPASSKAPPPGDDDILALADRLPKASRADLLKRVDELLAAARDNYENGDWCNLLHDVRDVLASQAANADAAAYIQWRVEHEDWFGFGATTPGQAPPAPEEIAATPHAAELEKRAAAAPPALKPQWLYLRGALGFCQGDRQECAPWFARVWKEYPDHPRAEAALFLSARCAFSQSHQNPVGEPDFPPDEEKRQKARDVATGLFRQYFDKYPSGRFLADADGWMGALDYEQKRYEQALDDYIRQLETPGHPEVAKSALFMCEKILAKAPADDDALFALAARHPLIAMGATYFALNREEGPTPPSDQYKEVDPQRDFARSKKWRQTILPKLAAQVAAQKEQYRSDGWPPKYLALLAQAASDAGNQAEALALTDSPQLDGNDDLLLARGVAFQRAGNPAGAIAAFRSLLEHFPKSQLARGARLKLAVALQDNHQAGLALLELEKLRTTASPERAERYALYPPADRDLPFTVSAAVRDISGAEAPQIDQVIDALYNFAPLPDLESALAAPELGEPFRARLESVLAERFLAREDFAAAKPFLAGNSPARALAARLEILTEKAGAMRTPASKAQALLELGDAWAAAQGSLLKTPLDQWETEADLFASNDDQSAMRRRRNGIALGYKNTDQELEERDELRHASCWWMRAARALPGSPLAAAARWKALQAIPELAQGSDYAFLRAVETNAGTTSRELYDRLRAECPNSIEAKQEAVYWSFPMHQPKPDSFPAFDEHTESERNALGRMGYTDFDDGAFRAGGNDSLETMDWDADQRVEKLKDRILALQKHAGDWDAKQLAAEVESLRTEVASAHPGLEDSRYLNLLDDLALFVQEPAVSPETRRAYFELRILFSGFGPQPAYDMHYEENEKRLAEQRTERIAQLMADPVLKSVPDYLDFIRAAQGKLATVKESPSPEMDDEVTFYFVRTQESRNLEASMREFLKRYPASRKREAARLLLARAVHWLTTPLIRIRNEKDDAEDWVKRTEMQTPFITKVLWPEKFEAPRAFEPLDAYEREFSRGRYAADIRNYRGCAALQARDWGAALDATMATLEDQTHPELQTEAAMRLATILGVLNQPDERPSLLSAIRQRPNAVEYLRQYLAKTWEYKDHPLRYLGGYLADQLSFKYEEPSPAAQ